MNRASIPRILLCASLSLFLAGCEAMLIGGTAGLAMAWFRGEGVKEYDRPYGEVADAVVEASEALHIEGYELARGERKTVITGKDVDGNGVKIRVYPLDGGHRAEVRIRIGAMGEYVPTKVFVDSVNEQLGLPPEPSRH